MKRRIALGILLLASPITERALAQPPAAADPPIVFSKDIAPILYRHCAACHRPNGPAPFSLITYDDARTRAAQIATATARRYMPPWKPQPGYGDFVGERRLSDTEIVSLRRWATSGRLEGDLKDLPSPPRFSSGWSLGEPDLVVSLPEYQLRAGGPDVFRNFVVPVPASATRYVGALEFRPGSRAVHHANIRVDPTPASRRLDDDDPVPGYEGVILRSADYPDGHFLGWTPGQLPSPGPNALAWRLEAGVDFVVQLHLQPTGKQERIVPSIGLYFAKDAPVRTPAILRLGRQNLEIPA
ncbi:MAG TPA: cytochrome c, partial [Vicinamibacterales bacterium]|nr:cytochrome c [Vicinamibacterales bacterium]